MKRMLSIIVVLFISMGVCFAKDNQDVAEGRDIWFKSTFGGERFFSLVLPNPPFNLRLGLDKMLTWPRNTRFDEFGVINDPDCTSGDAATGYLDRCADPESAGVIGIRKFPNPSGGPPLIGITCAACHAGFDPVHPPLNPNHPQQKNIHPTVGNQYVQIGKIFRANLSPNDPRYQVFSSWAPGTIDTTVLENDHINNPGMITPIWSVPDRPFFDVTISGDPARVHRNGQGVRTMQAVNWRHCASISISACVPGSAWWGILPTARVEARRRLISLNAGITALNSCARRSL